MLFFYSVMCQVQYFIFTIWALAPLSIFFDVMFFFVLWILVVLLAACWLFSLLVVLQLVEVRSAE